MTTLDPWLLSHGVLFIINYSVLMPIASFVILFDREKYYQLHNILGIAITLVLVAGWGCLTGATADKENNVVHSPLNPAAIGLSHSPMGLVARFVAVSVCIVGVVLGVVRMPKHVRPLVRYAHAVGGIGISLYGPSVVWTGFVRLQPFTPAIKGLSGTPMVWYTCVLATIMVYVADRIRRIWLASKASTATAGDADAPTTELVDIEKSVPVLSVPDVVALIADNSKSIFFFYESDLIQIEPESFDHPGGFDLLHQFNGKDITHIFNGSDSFFDQGRQRFVAHSAAAVRGMYACRVGRVASQMSLDEGSTVMGGNDCSGIRSVDELGSSFGRSLLSIDEEGKSVGIVNSIEQLNESIEYPVHRYVVRIVDPIMMSRISAGMKVRLSLCMDDPSAVERTYTVVSVDSQARTVELIIKIYPDGELTSRLAELSTHSLVFLSGLALGPSMNGDPILSIFAAGGTGIVPIFFYLSRTQSPTYVFWSIRRKEDVFLVDSLNRLINDHPSGVKLTVLLTGESDCPSSDYLGFTESVDIRTGRIDGQLLSTAVGDADVNEVSVVMSGPKSFIEGVHASVAALGVPCANVLSLD